MYFDLHLVVTDGALLHHDVDIAVVGEFNRVADQVSNYLLETQRVANDIVRHVVAHADGQFQPFIVRRVREQRDHFIKRGTQRERNAFQQQFPGLKFREIQHVINDAEQIICRTLDGIEVIALGWREVGFQRQAGKANHAIQRRAQLMRHISEKFRLNARRFLGAFFRQIQLNVLDLHLLQRFTKIRRCLIDIVLHLFMVSGKRHRH